MARCGLRVAERLREAGLDCAVYNCSSLKPVDGETLRKAAGGPFFTLEEHMIRGGFGQTLREICAEEGLRQPEEIFGVKDVYLEHGGHALLMRDAGLDEDSLFAKIQERMERSRR